MGFSVSGAMAVILIGAFVAFGIAFPTMVQSVEHISSANSDQLDRIQLSNNADIEFISAEYNSSQNNVTVEVENTGTVEIPVETMDFLVDGEYQTTDFVEYSIVNASDWSSILLPGETLVVTISGFETSPDVVKVVSKFGQAVRGEVV